jgi:hypothetical protein
MKNLMLFAVLMVIFACFCSGQTMTIQRGAERFPVRELPDGGKSVTINGRTYFLVAKEDLAALSAESEVFRSLVTKNDTLFAQHDALLLRYARYEEAAESLLKKHDAQIQQAEAMNVAYKDLYTDLKRMAGLSPWTVSAGLGIQSIDSEVRILYAVGVGYQHWVAQYQFARNYSGMLVGFRLAL